MVVFSGLGKVVQCTECGGEICHEVSFLFETENGVCDCDQLTRTEMVAKPRQSE